MALRRTSKRVLPRPMPKPLSRSCSTPVPRPSSNNPASFGGLGLPLTGPPAPDMLSELTRKPARPERAPDFEFLLIIATAEDALVRVMCNGSPSAMVGSGQPPSPQKRREQCVLRVSRRRPRTHVFVRRFHGLFLYRAQANPQKFWHPRQRARSSLFAANAKGRLHRLPASGQGAPQKNHRGSAGGIRCRLSDRLAQRFRR